MNQDLDVKEWMRAFYAEKKFADNAEKDRWAFVRLGPIKIPFPNLRQRREAIWLHDLNHLLTGYDTTWSGEGEIAAWELASGFPRNRWIGYVYPPFTFLVGLVVSPNRTLRAFRQGLGQKNVYQLQVQRDVLESMKMSDLKMLLEKPRAL